MGFLRSNKREESRLARISELDAEIVALRSAFSTESAALRTQCFRERATEQILADPDMLASLGEDGVKALAEALDEVASNIARLKLDAGGGWSWSPGRGSGGTLEQQAQAEWKSLRAVHVRCWEPELIQGRADRWVETKNPLRRKVEKAEDTRRSPYHWEDLPMPSMTGPVSLIGGLAYGAIAAVGVAVVNAAQDRREYEPPAIEESPPRVPALSAYPATPEMEALASRYAAALREKWRIGAPEGSVVSQARQFAVEQDTAERAAADARRASRSETGSTETPVNSVEPSGKADAAPGSKDQGVASVPTDPVDEAVATLQGFGETERKRRADQARDFLQGRLTD